MAWALGVDVAADVDVAANVDVPVDVGVAVEVEVAVGVDVAGEALHPTRTKHINPATLFLIMRVS